MKHRFLSIILLLAFIVASYVFLIKGVKPFLEAVVSSDLFLVFTDDPAEKFAMVSNEKSRLAALQCNQYLRENYQATSIGELTEEDYTAWALGNYSYIINTAIAPDHPTGSPSEEKFVCKIQWDSDNGDAYEYESWDIIQFDYSKQNG